MIGKLCIHILTSRVGEIIYELKSTDKFPEQWGIYWFSGNEGPKHAENIRKYGLINFWQDKEKIEIL